MQTARSSEVNECMMELPHQAVLLAGAIVGYFLGRVWQWIKEKETPSRSRGLEISDNKVEFAKETKYPLLGAVFFTAMNTLVLATLCYRSRSEGDIDGDSSQRFNEYGTIVITTGLAAIPLLKFELKKDKLLQLSQQKNSLATNAVSQEVVIDEDLVQKRALFQTANSNVNDAVEKQLEREKGKYSFQEMRMELELSDRILTKREELLRLCKKLLFPSVEGRLSLLKQKEHTVFD